MKLARALAWSLVLVLPGGCAIDSTRSMRANHAWVSVSSGWASDPIWHDGKAEKCVYEATRTIYGVERRYLAIAYTNTERLDQRTTCKTDGPDGVEVFKHHWIEVVPTERYDYRFSTMSYHRSTDGVPEKLTVSTQEDCGASFKECWRWKDTYEWWDSVYFPGAGRRTALIPSGHPFEFADTLSIALRLSAAPRPGEERALKLLPAQKDTHQTNWDLVKRRVRSTGRSTQELPIGRLEADGFEVLDETGVVLERFWFAADATAPILRAMVRYEGPNGVTYRLKSHERTAYWKR